MTMYLNLDDDDIFNKFCKKYEEMFEKEDENFDLVKFIKDFQKEKEKEDDIEG